LKFVYLSTMLDHLRIQNFRIFEHLELQGLKQVNLFTGKNNTGKTILLEALRLLSAPNEPTVYFNLLASRGQFDKFNLEIWDTFFNRNILTQSNNVVLKINELEISRNVKIDYPFKDFEIRFNGKISDDANLVKFILSIDKSYQPQDKAVYVPFGGEYTFPLQKYWDKIVLTDLEDAVMHILRESILPDLIRLDVKDSRILVRLKNEKSPIDLKSLGDGTQRLLHLAVALVSARNNILLIDEIEVGLHYSVLEIFWDKIFHYAKEWNIQVFVTTHSYDAVKTYLYAMEKIGNVDLGAYFRLQPDRKLGMIEAINYTKADLEFSITTDLEPR